jgi:hypothetical protein
MKVRELIELLEKQDQNASIEFPLQTYTQIYPTVYVDDEPKVTKAPDQNYGEGYSIEKVTRVSA